MSAHSHHDFVTGTKRHFRLLPWAIFATFALAIVAHRLGSDLAHTAWRGDLSIDGVAQWGRDFVNVYTSGKLALAHRLDLLYDVEAYQHYQRALFQSGLRWHNYSYPPVTLLYSWAFALLPYKLALIAWLGGTGAFFAWAARPYMKGAGLPAWAALLAPASLVNLWTGHYGFLIGGLWLAAWHLLPRRPGTAGVLIGLMVVKPHLAILLPLVLAWRREWRAFAFAAATAGSLVAASILLFGTGLWVTYLTGTAALQAGMVDDVGAFFLTMMPTVTPALVSLGFAIGAALAAQAAVAVAAVALLLRGLPDDAHQTGLATATATFLVLPYAFAYDMTVAGLAGLFVFAEAVRRQAQPLYLFAAGATALAPMTISYLALSGLPVAPLFCAFQLAVLLGLLRPVKTHALA